LWLRPKLVGPWFVEYKGDCFAKAHLSAAQAPARQDARVSFANEDRRRPQGACGAAQEGPSSAHSRIIRDARTFRGKRGWCGAESLTRCTAPGSAGRVLTSLVSFARIKCRRAASALASRRRWAARWCAIACDGKCAKSCAAAARRYPQDGTSSYTRRVRWRARRLRR
jgi:hypothetical protein